MPIYHRHKLVHIHIPKTGGSAIESYFHEIGDMEWGPGSWYGREELDGRWYEFQHLTWHELVELSGLPLDEYDSFAVVRDPYARLISDFLWRRRIVENRPESPLRWFDSFRNFLLAIPHDLETRWAEYIHDADREDANVLIHVRPQHHYVFDDTGDRPICELLRFEDLDRELRRLLDRYALSASKIQRPSNRDLMAFYDRELLDRVNDLYRKDFDRLGYTPI